ncbi:MAG TPA: N-acetylglucosamine-6-phosphate deacetylase [Pyrinomonadaceae bacterium]|jgi:N-acetylglucosamine-6-phosphate deacetylase|nr:N-acetylglucosamine-6-phosphate deacetylase [Pyrinomonadaceae bacterium]
MKTLLLRGARVVLPRGVAEDACVLVAGGRIEKIFDGDDAKNAGDAQTVNLSGLTLFPGLIDVHIHGARGFDTMEASAGDLLTVARFLTTQGVTAWLPTLVPAPVEDYRRALSAIAQLMREQEDERATAATARVLGVHYEGPFVNEAQCGALRTPYFRTYSTPADLDALPTLDAPHARHMITLAPEISGGVELVRELKSRGWIVSIGHTRADVQVLERACAAGARHMTHFLNAMSPLHHRAPGPVGWGLMRDDVTCDIIADGVHSDPLMIGLVVRCKGASRVTLISDAVAPAGLGDGEYQVWNETITVTEGRTSNARGHIAGSVSMMRDGVRMLRSLGLPAHEIARMTAHNPARLLGLEDICGSIEEGNRADIVAMDDEGRVRLTLVGGRIAFDEKDVTG